MATISIDDINSSGIRYEAERMGVTTATIIGRGEAVEGNGNSHCTFYRVGDVRVAQTNGDPVWEESMPEDFAELAEACGVDLKGPAARIASARDLDALCSVLNAICASTPVDERPDYGPYMTSKDLPAYGGEEPKSTAGIYSWDATRLLVPDEEAPRGGWRIIPRVEA